METTSTEVMSIWHRNDIEKSTWRSHRYFVDFESRIHVELMWIEFPRGFAVQNECNFNELSTWNFDVKLMANGWRYVYCDLAGKHIIARKWGKNFAPLPQKARFPNSHWGNTVLQKTPPPSPHLSWNKTHQIFIDKIKTNRSSRTF